MARKKNRRIWRITSKSVFFFLNEIVCLKHLYIFKPLFFFFSFRWFLSTMYLFTCSVLQGYIHSYSGKILLCLTLVYWFIFESLNSSTPLFPYVSLSLCLSVSLCLAMSVFLFPTLSVSFSLSGNIWKVKLKGKQGLFYILQTR